MILLFLYPRVQDANVLHVELLGKGRRSPGETGRKRFVDTTLRLSVSIFLFHSPTTLMKERWRRRYSTKVQRVTCAVSDECSSLMNS